MTRVWVARCVCPSGHEILALCDAADGQEEAAAKIQAPLRGLVQEWIRRGVLASWCSKCGSRRWNYEISPAKAGREEHGCDQRWGDSK